MKNLIENKYLECEKELKININLSVEDVMFIKGKKLQSAFEQAEIELLSE